MELWVAKVSTAATSKDQIMLVAKTADMCTKLDMHEETLQQISLNNFKQFGDYESLLVNSNTNNVNLFTSTGKHTICESARQNPNLL